MNFQTIPPLLKDIVNQFKEENMILTNIANRMSNQAPVTGGSTYVQPSTSLNPYARVGITFNRN